jgi:uncharacterized protein (DUF1800 family)
MASLNEFTGVLGKRKAKHLLRRACLNYDKATLDTFAALTPSQALAALTTTPSTPFAEPYDPVENGSFSQCAGTTDAYWLSSGNPPSHYNCGQSRKRSIVSSWWWYNAINQNSLKHKLTFFLHTTFTISKDDGSGRSGHFYDYLRLLEFYAYGSIKTLAKKITFDNAMLYYLDNHANNKNNPNENYSREFLELFTICKGPQVGEGDYTNYTEHDVVMAAKVFSGIKFKALRDTIDPDTGIPMGYINASQHNTGNKTFSHAFGNTTISGGNNANGVHQELDDFVDMIFNQLETAKAYCRKLYRFYVQREWGQEVEDDIITPLANQLMNDNGNGTYNLLDALTTLLSSEHFYDEDDSDNTNNIIGSKIKNPLQLLSETLTIFEFPIPNPDPSDIGTYSNFYKFWHNFCNKSVLPGGGMGIFAPDTVAGYPADYQAPMFDRAWFTSNNIIARYNLMGSLLQGRNLIAGPQMNNNGNTYYIDIFSNLDIVDHIKQNISIPSDQYVIVTELSELMYCESIDNSRKDYFMEFLVPAGFPIYYWGDVWNSYLSGDEDDALVVKNRLEQLVIKMVNAAEFQLM